MANYEHKAGNGSLFKNKYKEKENQPDYRGSGKTEDGQDIEIAGWIKQTNNGEQMLSLSFSKPYKKPDENQVTSGSDTSQVDDLPF